MRFHSIIAAGVLCAAAHAAVNSLTQEEARAGWILLFDGNTMEHWTDPRKMAPPGDSWVVEDQCLKAQRGPRIMEDLFSTETFRDFELEFAWRISPAGEQWREVPHPGSCVPHSRSRIQS